MSDPDTSTILKALHDHREETRQDMHRLHDAVVKIADAASDMGKTMARSEERHVQHEDANRRINRNLEDHETRIRGIESEIPEIERVKHHAKELGELKIQMLTGNSSIKGGWKVLTVLGALFVGAVAAASLLLRVST